MYKKIKKLFIFMFFAITMFFNIGYALGAMNYKHIGEVSGGTYIPDFDTSYTITLNEYNEGESSDWSDLGGDEPILDWNKEYYPSIILVDNNNADIKWYGYDDLDSVIKDSSTKMLVFISEEYEANVDFSEYIDGHFCEYTFQGSTAGIMTFNFDPETGTFKNLSEKENTVGMTSYSYTYQYNFVEDEITTYLDEKSGKGICPILYIGITQTISTGSQIYDFVIYSDSYLREVGGDDCVLNRDDICLGSFFTGKYTFYYTGTLTDSEINKDNVEKSMCPSYDLLERDLKIAYGSNQLAVANEYVRSIKDVCQRILSYRPVIVEGTTIMDACVDLCLDFSTKLEEIKEDYGIGDNGRVCGFSQKLAIWIGNIVRWGKYLIPVLVIVLGILDFIKAIAADKDDEMKKAQGRFVKRLIAAALIFIVPFIIEFVLGKLGFDSNGCGIIDL